MSGKRDNFTLTGTFFLVFSEVQHSTVCTVFQCNLRGTFSRLHPRTAQPIKKKKLLWFLLKFLPRPSSREEGKGQKGRERFGGTCQREAAGSWQMPAGGRGEEAELR